MAGKSPDLWTSWQVNCSLPFLLCVNSDLQCCSSSSIQSLIIHLFPNIERKHALSYTYTCRSHVCGPLCQPAINSLMTSINKHRHQVAAKRLSWQCEWLPIHVSPSRSELGSVSIDSLLKLHNMYINDDRSKNNPFCTFSSDYKQKIMGIGWKHVTNNWQFAKLVLNICSCYFYKIYDTYNAEKNS